MNFFCVKCYFSSRQLRCFLPFHPEFLTARPKLRTHDREILSLAQDLAARLLRFRGPRRDAPPAPAAPPALAPEQQQPPPKARPPLPKARPPLVAYGRLRLLSKARPASPPRPATPPRPSAPRPPPQPPALPEHEQAVIQGCAGMVAERAWVSLLKFLFILNVHC